MARPFAMGWRRDLPDWRDYTPKHEQIRGLLTSRRLNQPADAPRSCDLRKWCSPIEDQQTLGSCTANAGVGVLEYFERRAFGKHIDASRLFLYKVTRNLMGWTGDTGAYLRTTMKAMALFGAPPEDHCPYDIASFDAEPSAFLYAYGQNYQSLRYFRLDPPGEDTSAVLKRVKDFLAAGYPSMFGFTVYNFGNDKGELAFPGPQDSVQGGHAIVAVGYDDERRIGAHQGALRIRNSWGTGWGEEGYGWLPYEYVKQGLAVDFWSVFRAEYVETGKFDD